MLNRYDIAVIGGGPAGLAAALAASERGIQHILIIEREPFPGGILKQCIHSGFGMHCFKEELTGPEFAQKFVNRVKNSNIEIKLETMVIDISNSGSGSSNGSNSSNSGSGRIITAVNRSDGLMTISAGAIILAMGCRERTREAIGIPGTRPAGIFTAGTAQKLVNLEGYMPGKRVVVLGSGDIGLIMARRMTLEGAEVLMVCEVMPYSTGLNRNIVQCLYDFNIPLKLNHTVVKIHGSRRLEGVTTARVNESLNPIPESEEYVECDTLLLAVGLIPENELSRKAGVLISPVTGGPIVDDSMETSVPGIFACGNCVHVHDLADYVTLEGERAGLNAALYLNNSNNSGRSNMVKNSVVPGFGVRYCVPSFVSNTGTNDDLVVYFRSDNIYSQAYITASTEDGCVLAKRKKQTISPGELQELKIKRSLCAEKGKSIVISIQQK